MGRKKPEMALESAWMPAEGFPPPPTESAFKAAIALIVDKIKAAEAAAIARLPEELRGNAFIIENILNQELDKIGMTSWRQVLMNGFLADLADLKSEAPHDPTELA